MGTATVVDPGVRSAREVKAADFVVLSAETLQEVPLGDFGASLCWSLDQRCRFTPKKINIYSPGDFFSIHKDTPRSKTHIGTLVIVLQHPEEGGEFVVYDNFGKEQIVQTNQDMNSVVIYTDIDHEVRKVLSGLRITLTVDIEWDGQSEEEGESGTFGEDRLRCPRTITMVRRKSVESGDGKLVRERVEEICGGVLRAVGESEEFGVMLYHEYVKGVKEKCLKGIDKELFWYFKKKGWEVRLCPVIILKTDVSGDWKHEISFSFYQLPSIFVNPDESFSLEKFKESKEKERMEKMEMKQKERMERKARRGLEGEDEEEEEEEDERTPLVVFTQPQMKLVKHVEGAEYTGNEGMDEEYFYYITAITVRLPSAMSSLEDSDESSPSPCPPPQDDKPSQLQDSDKPSPSPIPPQDDQPSQ
uniref:Fe2OG dioxygenase domain-containing protein n=1 Tax=Arcella intermedia TaxID=1963864 RepID=A0A6B2L4I4_9EUKA